MSQWSSERAGRPATPLTRVLATIHGNLNSSGFNPREILRQIGRLLDEEGLWVGEVDERGRPMTLQAALKAPWPVGVGMTDKDIEHVLEAAEDRDLDPELIGRIRLAITPKTAGRGRPEKGSDTTFLEDNRGKRYKLRRLRRDHPDIAARVDAGEISATAGCIEAGIEKPKASIRVDSAEEAIRALLRRFSADELRAALDRGGAEKKARRRGRRA